MIGQDGPRNASEEDEWLMQRQRENAEYEAYAEAQREWEETPQLDQLDEQLDSLDKELALDPVQIQGMA